MRKHDPIKELLDKIQSQIDKNYDDIYIFRHNIGESYVELMHLADTIKANDSKNPLLVLWDKKYAGFYKMFLSDGVDMQYINLLQVEIQILPDRKDVVAHNNQRFICTTPLIAQEMKKLLATKPDVNFYDYITNAAGIQKGAVPALPHPCMQSIRRVKSKVKRIELSEKFIILCPEATSLKQLTDSFWETLAEGLRKKGYDIFCNVHDGSIVPKNMKTAKMTIEELFILSKQSEGIITLGSGLAVFLTAAGVKMDVFYTDFSDKKIGYDAGLALRIYSVHHLPGVSQEEGVESARIARESIP